MQGAGTKNFDVAIIGGGIIGLSSAWYLASSGLSVAIFERSQTGQEASFAAAGMLAPGCERVAHPWPVSSEAQAEMFNFCHASRKLYPVFADKLLEATGIDSELSLRDSQQSDWREPGILFVPQNDNDPRRSLLLEHLPGLANEGGVARDLSGKPAVFLPAEGQVDNRKLATALRAAAIKSGVQIREACPIRGLKIEGERAVGVISDQETIHAGNVLLCGGAWSGQIERLPPEITASVRPLAGQVLQLRSEQTVRHVIYSDDCYLVPRRDGRLLVGATVEDIGFRKQVTAGGVAQLLAAAFELVPDLRNAPLEAHWAGLRPATPDALPLLGATSLDNLFVATGHGRNGILLAPITAATLTANILGTPSFSATFSPARFAASA